MKSGENIYARQKKTPGFEAGGFLVIVLGPDFRRGDGLDQLHPDVVPQVSHLRQVPFLTMVNWPHSRQGSPW